MGDMENAQKMVDHLEGVDQADSADTLSRYMYKVDPPKMLFGMSTSSFPFSMGKGHAAGGAEQLPDERRVPPRP